MFDWDDLRIFIAAARAGSLAGAGRRLGVDTATVGRRVARLESVLKSILLMRSGMGLQLTAAGAQLLEVALNAESAMEAAMRVTRPDLIAGTVRISAAEGFGTQILAPALPVLSRLRPGLRIELAAQPRFLSPARREVDLSITLSATAGARLIVEPLAAYQLALYAAESYLERRPAPASVEDLSEHAIVGYVDDLLFAPELRYLDEVLPGLTPNLASSSIQAQRAIVAGGGGIGVLPCFLSAGLVRVLSTDVLLHRRFWLNTHEEVYATARMKAVHAWLSELVKERHRAMLPY
jgi:DNA-binding transcriptional LysR family regulator